MTRILMRAGMLPWDNYNADYLISNNTIGTNAGNMFFPHSLSRALMVEDTTIDSILTGVEFSEKEIEEINETYDCFIIPLANAFRETFIPELQRLTKLIKRLKIPCIVVGVGIQAKATSTGTDAYNYDEAAKEFIRAVLEKSNTIGVRGEATAGFMRKHGFIEGSDFTVIGCPSLFLFGNNLPKIEKKESMVCFNSRARLPEKLHQFTMKCREQFPNHYYIPQNTNDYWLLYAGVPLSLKEGKVWCGYPQRAKDEIFRQDRVRAFLNVPTWLEFLSHATLSFGSRIHGNIAGVLAGIPTFIFAHDSRTRELADYHNIPYMFAKDITDETNLQDLYEKADFTSTQRGHRERFNTFISFLQQNGLRTIYDETSEPKVVPFDEKMDKIDFYPPVHSFISQEPKEKAVRIKMVARYVAFDYPGKRIKNQLLKHSKKESK